MATPILRRRRTRRRRARSQRGKRSSGRQHSARLHLRGFPGVSLPPSSPRGARSSVARRGRTVLQCYFDHYKLFRFCVCASCGCPEPILFLQRKNTLGARVRSLCAVHAQLMDANRSSITTSIAALQRAGKTARAGVGRALVEAQREIVARLTGKRTKPTQEGLGRWLINHFRAGGSKEMGWRLRGE